MRAYNVDSMRFRMAINAFTGLMFLAQGFALAAVVVPAAAADASMAAAAMPCHHAGTPTAPKPPCCADGCIGMVACATAHLALTSAPLSFASPAARIPAPAHDATALPPPRIAFRLRPPIALHA